MTSLWWIFRKFYAQKHRDFLIVTFDKIEKAKTPPLLKFLGCELLEISYSNPEKNPNTEKRKFWLIQEKSTDIYLGKLSVLRIDSNRFKNIVVWRRIK